MIETYYLLYSDWAQPLFGIILAVVLIVVFAIVIKDRLSHPSQSSYSNAYSYTPDKNNAVLPKGYESNSESNLSDSNNFKVFLDIDNKVWKVKDKEFAVIENCSDEELKWFDDTFELTIKNETTGEISQSEADIISNEWDERVCRLGLGAELKTIKEILTEKELGELMGELSHFVRKLKTIENARQLPLYDLRLQVQSGELNESDLQNNFQRYTWQQAEDIVGKLFEKKNYTVTIGSPTANGGIKRQGDFGIDVEAKNGQEYLGIQVKHWSMDVGFEDVAKTLGVAQKFNKVIIVSTKSGFTSQAWTHANDNPYLIELWDSNRFKNELRQYLLK